MSKESHTIKIKLAAPLSEFSVNFVQAMANRMSFSYHKYGNVSDADIDCLASADQRLEKYKYDGNTEWLVDAANFFMMEFMKNPNSFEATDSDSSPGRTRLDGTIDVNKNKNS